MSGRVLPTGTITFLVSDMEGSTRLVQRVGPGRFREILERHNAILRRAFRAHGGIERDGQGDSFLVAFHEAGAALAAAADAQAALGAASWPEGTGVRVRMGVHTGVGRLGGDDYVGLDVHRAARIASAAHGGQVLVSDATRGLARADLPRGTVLRSLGEHKLRDLAQPEEIHQLVVEGLPSSFPPIATEAPAAGNLPQRLTAFVGRDAELVELGRLLGVTRLLTLTGPGGTGKTSLAVELARREAAAFRHGAWLVRLDGISEAALVAPAIAGVLGLVASPDVAATDRLAMHVRDRSMLVVLDNFEQVLPAADLVGELLQAGPGLRVLVTSRAPLRLSAEQEHPVPPLPLPAEGGPFAEAVEEPALRLFAERARRVRPSYDLTPEDAPVVTEICRRLDGLPLGIELAASRVGLLPPRTIATLLAERLDLPGAGARDLPERQRSMERAIAWSYDLLDPPVQHLLDRLSAFRGGCRLEEAIAVCGPAPELGIDVLEGLSVLVDQSLVQPAPGLDGARFRLLETIQAFAAVRLAERGEDEELARRHARAYLAQAEEAAAHLPGGGQLPWLDRLTADQDNHRAAVRWATDHGEVEAALRFGAALWRFWQLRGHLEEGRAAMARILAMPGADRPTPARMWALAAAGGLRYWSADLEGADALYRSQLELARELGDAGGTADALYNLGHTRFLLARDHAEADRLADEAIRLYREVGDERAVARVGWTALNRAMERGLPGVEQQLEEALQRFEALGDEWYVAMTQATLGWAAWARGDVDGALHRVLAALRWHRAMGDIASTAIGLRGVAMGFAASGMPQEAVTTMCAFETSCRRYGVRPPAFFEELGPGSPGYPAIDVAAHPEAAARGAAMSIEEALDYVVRVIRERVAPAG